MKFQSGTPSRRWLMACLGIWLLGGLTGPGWSQTAKLTLTRIPHDGIQPQVMVDTSGTVHLIYFKGESAAGNIFYACQKPDGKEFSEPIQVNRQPGSAVAIGTIRGAQLAVGRNGRVHVAWNGSKASDQHRGTPMFYTRLNDAGTAFEPERDLISFAAGLDGGGSVAADGQGNVYVMWHAAKPGMDDEAGRAVFVARSTDDGKTFARETLAITKETGACGCCGLRAFADSSGNVFTLYRAATELMNRDEILLVSRDHGATFEIANAHPWKLSSCPMSSASLSESKSGVLAAWETAGQVYFSRVASDTLKVSSPLSPPGNAARKHPVVVGNRRGEVLLVWTEGTGWQRGGAVAWQLFDATGQPLEEKGHMDGVPVWGFAAAVPRPDNRFVIFY